MKGTNGNGGCHFKLDRVIENFADHNRRVYNSDASVADCASRDMLFPAEAALFYKYRREIRKAKVLDVGVGGGRTTLRLLANCREYCAIDYAPTMIDTCRARFPSLPPETFAVGDARDLRTHPSGSYQFVLFSFNGLDYINHDDRRTALLEIRRVLDVGGLFLFSTHSLHAFPFRDAPVQARNAHVDAAVLAQQGWYQLIDYADQLVTYYIYPAVQARYLETSGFAVLDVLDMKGLPFNFCNPCDDWMVHFMCRAA